MMDVGQPVTQAKTGAEIVAMLEAIESPIELVDPDIEDPVEHYEDRPLALFAIYTLTTGTKVGKFARDEKERKMIT